MSDGSAFTTILPKLHHSDLALAFCATVHSHPLSMFLRNLQRHVDRAIPTAIINNDDLVAPFPPPPLRPSRRRPLISPGRRRPPGILRGLVERALQLAFFHPPFLQPFQSVLQPFFEPPLFVKGGHDDGELERSGRGEGGGEGSGLAGRRGGRGGGVESAEVAEGGRGRGSRSRRDEAKEEDLCERGRDSSLATQSRLEG